jgi:hypothetical protein
MQTSGPTSSTIHMPARDTTSTLANVDKDDVTTSETDTFVSSSYEVASDEHIKKIASQDVAFIVQANGMKLMNIASVIQRLGEHKVIADAAIAAVLAEHKHLREAPVRSFVDKCRAKLDATVARSKPCFTIKDFVDTHSFLGVVVGVANTGRSKTTIAFAIHGKIQMWDYSGKGPRAGTVCGLIIAYDIRSPGTIRPRWWFGHARPTKNELLGLDANGFPEHGVFIEVGRVCASTNMRNLVDSFTGKHMQVEVPDGGNTLGIITLRVCHKYV